MHTFYLSIRLGNEKKNIFETTTTTKNLMIKWKRRINEKTHTYKIIKLEILYDKILNRIRWEKKTGFQRLKTKIERQNADGKK